MLAGARSVICDVSDEAQVASLIDGIERTEGRLDGLVCNAGFMIRKPIEELTLEEWSSVLATNLTSTFLLVKAAAPNCCARRRVRWSPSPPRGRICPSRIRNPMPPRKGGLVALTHALAVSLGPDIRVNCISPGWIDTGHYKIRPHDHAQHPAGRVGRVEDIAAMAAYLLGPESRFMTGTEIIIDGGMTRKMIYEE